jgi:pilus assembly protein FimV
MAFRVRFKNQLPVGGKRGSRMFRNSALVSTLALALLPGVSGALGLGGIQAQSALNEPFSAQIYLSDVATDELDTVKVSLASEVEFAKAGTERPFFLTNLKFRPQISSNGRAVIRVTSREPIKEPFLDFLVRVDWPKGQLIKEYTVLLDPPVTVNRPLPKQVQLARLPASVDTSAFPMHHGPVQKGSNLWGIARNMAPAAGASVAQTAMALYRANQAAFIHGNINQLRVGTVLEIPSANELFALDEGQADREFKAAIRGERVTAAPLTNISASQPEDRLQIASIPERAPWAKTPDTEQTQAAPSPQPSSQTTAETAGHDRASGTPAQTAPTGLAGQHEQTPTGGERRPGIGTIKNDLLLVQEAGESTRQETEELRGRIRELESQLSDIQRLLELSNERFAALQKSEPGQSEGPGLDPSADAPASQIEPHGKPEETVRGGIAAASTREDAPSAGTSHSDPENATSRGHLQAASDTDRYFWESVSRPPAPLVLSLALLLLILGWIYVRQRRRLEATLVPADLPPATPATAPANVRTASPAAERPPLDVASDLKDPTPSSELGNLGAETEERDVLSEAEVYIAYGRYREAAAILEEEINASPDRLDAKYKLADAYYGARDTKRLKALLEHLHMVGSDQADPDQWNRISGMLENLEGDGSEGPHPIAPGGAVRAAPSAENVERSMPQGKIPSPGTVRPDPTPEPDTETGLRPLDSPSQTQATPTQADSPGPPSQDMDLDIEDLDIMSTELSAPLDEASLPTREATSDLEIQLEDFDDLEQAGSTAASSASPYLDPLSLKDVSELPPDSQVDSLDISQPSIDILDSDFSSPHWYSSHWHKDSGMSGEVATKIDLARAYIEMEDPEAARILLEEVEREGNETQRAEAGAMMERLG